MNFTLRGCRQLLRPLNHTSHRIPSIQHVQYLYPTLSQNRTFFGSNKKPDQNESHLHVFLLKDGNKHMMESPLMSISDYDQAIDIQETSESLSKRAFAYFHIKDYEQANRDIQKAIKLNPRSIECYCCAASIEVALDNHERALTHLTEAYDLSSPMDFRRSAIEEVINGCKVSLRVNAQSMQGLKQTTATQTQIETGHEFENEHAHDDTYTATDTVADAHVVYDSSDRGSSDSNDSYNLPINKSSGVVAEEHYRTAATKMVDMPFDNSEFMDLQKDITQQMVDIGGEEFQAKLMKLNDIPAVQSFQRKALSGQKPTYDDYMSLMKDPKFQVYNSIMTEIAKNPKFSSITQKFANMDWMGAYEELKKDPEALQLYMKAFEALD